VSQYEVASFVRRFLHHPLFATYSRRRGVVVRVGHNGLHVQRAHVPAAEEVLWPR
jgi:hypothetical protein